MNEILDIILIICLIFCIAIGIYAILYEKLH